MAATTRIRAATSQEAVALTGLARRSKAFRGYSDEFMDACREEMTLSPEAIADDTGNYAVAEANGGKRLRIQSDPNATKFYLAAGAHQIGTLESGSISGRHLPLLEINVSNE